MSDLYQLAQSDKPWVAQRAQMALELQAQHARGDIDNSEYAELMEDLVRTDVLEGEADDMHMKTMLVQAIWIASKVV
jgi:hypothetical protein